MNEASFASLNPALLARKGGAKPAMRPQLGPIPDGSANASGANLDDLGWNDMGDDGDSGDSAQILQLGLPKPANEADPARAQDGPIASAEANVQDLGTDLLKAKVRPNGTCGTAQAKKHSGKRAAFTLRLDPERHLKLRLAATMMNRSAQQIVTEALDSLLSEIEELESLAARLRRS